MAVPYAIEFPLADSKSKGPYIVPESKVRVENGQIKVLWSVVGENGDLLEEYYFDATNLKKGSKRDWDCAEFIDCLKESREKADISNKEGQSHKKPSKLNDYEDPDNLNSTNNVPPLKKRPRKVLFTKDLNNLSSNSAEKLDEDEDVGELDGSAVLVCW